MAQVINTNSLSLLTQNNLNKSQSSLSSAIERLSSGLRINSAKDDAAGQAIANRFTSNIKGLTQASRNANDGISIAQTTEGALNEINNNLQRVRELSVQAANGSNSGSDLTSIQDEIDQRLNEINRVAEQTDFNGKKVLNEDGKLTIQVGAKDNETITIDLKKIDRTTLGLDNFNVANTGLSLKDGADIKIAPTLTDTKAAAIANAKLVTDGKDYFVTDGAKYYAATKNATSGEYEYASDAQLAGAAIPSPTSLKDAKTVTVAANTAAIDPNAGESFVTYKKSNGEEGYAIKVTGANGKSTFHDATITADGTVTKGAQNNALDLTVDPMDKLDEALKTVDAFRSQLGAVQNRFESAITNLGNTVNNLSSARSRIEDSDYATEVSNMSRAQILQQAGTSVLAQANQTTQNVLSLLR